MFARQVLAVMRGAQLLSPNRARQGHVRAHDGRIVTNAPDAMRDTDAMRVQTVEGFGALGYRSPVERRLFSQARVAT